MAGVRAIGNAGPADKRITTGSEVKIHFAEAASAKFVAVFPDFDEVLMQPLFVAAQNEFEWSFAMPPDAPFLKSVPFIILGGAVMALFLLFHH
jgi:hypothetical protein